jgi:hypothetical protein
MVYVRDARIANFVQQLLGTVGGTIVDDYYLFYTVRRKGCRRHAPQHFSGMT